MTYLFLVTAPALGAGGVEVLAQAGCEVDYLPEGGTEADVTRMMASRPYDAVISRTLVLSGEAINACPSLRVICKHGVGVNNIDVTAATQRCVPVLTTPGTNTQSVAELALGMMFAAARRLPFLQQEIRSGRWSRSDGGTELAGKNLGLVGFGDIGRRVAVMAQAIGMQVCYYDPAVTQEDSDGVAEKCLTLWELMQRSQVLSLHCPVNNTTRGLFDAAALALLPKGAIVINTARGELLDEDALVQALREGRISAAGLDTFATEPLPAGHPFLTMDSVVMTPHTGGATREALDAVARLAATQCLDYLRGTPLSAFPCVNLQALKAQDDHASTGTPTGSSGEHPA